MVAASAALLWLDLAQIGDVRGHATGLSLERMIRLPNPEITPAIHNSDTEEYRVLDFCLSSSNKTEQNRTRVSMFETLPNTNRTRVVFGSVRCGAELEQTEQDPENVLFCLFVRLAISEFSLQS